jgi:hypothetical protein
MRHDGGNALKSQDNGEGLKALPLKSMESSMKTGVFSPSHENSRFGYFVGLWKILSSV